jgi:Tyrosine phosphatase family
MAEFFTAIAERPQQSIFIHCRLGADRTGVLVAAYRIAFEHGTPQMPIEEMHGFHFNSFWHPAMKEYIQHFPKRFATSDALAPYHTMPKSAAGPVPSLAPDSRAPFLPVPRYCPRHDSRFISLPPALLYALSRRLSLGAD